MEATFAWPVWRAAFVTLRPPLLALTALMAALGTVMAWSCGCGRDLPAAAATVLLAVCAHAAVQIGRDGAGAAAGAAARRDVAQMLGTVVAGGGVWLAARAGPWLAVIGAAGLVFGWIAAGPEARGAPWRRAALTAAVGWLLVVGADVVQRHRFDAIAAVAAVAPALLVAVVPGVAAMADGSAAWARRRGASWAVALTIVAAHLWAWVWWHAAWLPTPAAWALGSAVPAAVTVALLVAGAPARPWWRSPATWALVTAVSHLGGLAAAFLAVAALR